jgi:DNA-binding CsgD family transcriptional regulator
VRHAPVGNPPDQHHPHDVPEATPDSLRDVVAAASALLATPGLVVLHSGPGGGRSTALARLGAAFRGPVFAGGGLASLPAEPAFALTRAVRVRLPTHDPALLAEAVRARVRTGLLLLDDLQWADPATLAALVPLAAHCRVAVALRTPHRLPAPAVTALRSAAAGWLAIPPLDPAAATALATQVAPGLTPTAVADVVRRAGGTPLAVVTLARLAATGRPARPEPSPPPAHDTAQVEYAVAAALADLTRPARTAMAALGLLGRPATTAILGTGTDELAAAGLVTVTADATVTPVSPYVAEIAAGLLDTTARRALHRRLADLVPPAEAVRHLAAAGDTPAAYRRALAAAQTTASAATRADLLLTACGLPGVEPEPATRIAAARAALACGRPGAAARVLTTVAPLGVDADLLRAEALLQLGNLAAARATATRVPDSSPADQRAARDRILLLVHLGTAPTVATAEAARLVARYGPHPAHPGLRAALAAVHAADRAPGWETELAEATEAATAAGDPLTARWSAWLLVETLIADGRLVEAGHHAQHAERACAADLAYSWQTRFLAARLWCAALRGGLPTLPRDETVRRATDLIDRTVPERARSYAVAAASLVEADGGLLGPARARLARTPPATTDPLLDWTHREVAWLDGQPEQATDPPPAGPTLVDGLRQITARWAAHDLGGHTAPPRPAPATTGDRTPPPVARTLAAWDSPGGDPAGFTRAAADWRDLAVREEVRCLLAAGLHEPDPARGVTALLAAEQRAEEQGLVVLLGRTRRALRRHAVRRDHRGSRGRGTLTDREREVLRLVAAGEPTRRIAGRLGISGETVETHVRSAIRKLGARTRTEAAALALTML